MTNTYALTRVPFRPARSLWNIDGLFDRFLEGWESPWPLERLQQASAPAVDLEENEKELVVRADLPGVDPKDIKVTLNDDYLTIEGERKEEAERTEGKERYVERFNGSFCRTIHLPDRVDAEAIQAKHRNGVLEIACPCIAEAQPREIEVATK